MILCRTNSVTGQQSFTISFQTKSNGSFSISTDQWIEFKNEIPASKEFTVCHWIRVRYFNTVFPFNLWSYCAVKSVGKAMACIQIYLDNSWESASRNVKIKTWECGKPGKTSIEVENFLHRTWVYFCWSASSITGKSLFYYNGKLIGIGELSCIKNSSILTSSTEVYDAALIFGQEPDKMRGGFDKGQASIGDLSEFNLWNYVLSEVKVSDLAKCKDFERGNIVSWEKSAIETHNVLVGDLQDSTSLCSKEQRFVIFPKRMIFSQAMKTCEIHGGTLVVPTSGDENSLLLEIVNNHKSACVKNEILSEEKLVWIGIKKRNQVWYKIESGDTATERINYINMETTLGDPDLDCAYMQNNGLWRAGFGGACKLDTLCTICSIVNTPVFTMKGICFESDINWNYYMAINTSHQISYFDGYKDTKLIQGNDSSRWQFHSKEDKLQTHPLAKLLTKPGSGNYPIGRQKWLVNEPNCMIWQQEKLFVISKCTVGTQFTCNTGDCISLEQRCNERRDCSDNSDEENCFLVSIPTSHYKDRPPKPLKQNTSLQLLTSWKIINVDSIDTINMIVTLTVEVRIKWHDQRLRFFNPTANQDNVVPDKYVERMWIPLTDLIVDNAIIGETKYDDRKKVNVHPNISETTTVELAYENRAFNGSYNLLSVSRRMKASYNCMFHLYKFPFDKNKCVLVFRIDQHRNTKLVFAEDGPISYNGPNILNQFEIGGIFSEVTNSYVNTKFSITIPLSRVFNHQLLKTFIPTFILWLLAYSAIFIDVDRLDARLSTSVTAMLVQATWISLINGDLPKTSYVKLIDVWFIWHIVVTFVIIMYHILLEKFKNQEIGSNLAEEKLFQTPQEYYGPKMKKGKDKINMINRTASVVFSILNSIFYGIYFLITFE